MPSGKKPPSVPSKWTWGPAPLIHPWEGSPPLKILNGLPMGLDQATVDAVKRWKFKPATPNGKPVAVIYKLTVNFQRQ